MEAAAAAAAGGTSESNWSSNSSTTSPTEDPEIMALLFGSAAYPQEPSRNQSLEMDASMYWHDQEVVAPSYYTNSTDDANAGFAYSCSQGCGGGGVEKRIFQKKLLQPQNAFETMNFHSSLYDERRRPKIGRTRDLSVRNKWMIREVYPQQSSEDDSSSAQDINDEEENSGKKKGASSSRTRRACRGSTTDPQSLYMQGWKRRERINERLKTLQNLVPNGTKVDISTMLEEAVQYVNFLQLRIKVLSTNDRWMFAPIAYNGIDISLYLKISPPQ